MGIKTFFIKTIAATMLLTAVCIIKRNQFFANAYVNTCFYTILYFACSIKFTSRMILLFELRNPALIALNSKNELYENKTPEQVKGGISAWVAGTDTC